MHNVYDTSLTRFYDLLYPTPQAELLSLSNFLRETLDSTDILEFGIGTGRIAIPLANYGFTVKGIDTSESMLQVLHDKDPDTSVTAYIGDFVNDEVVEDNFSGVLLLCNTIFVARNLDEQVAIFENARRNLSSNGKFVVETFNPMRYLASDHSNMNMRSLSSDTILISQYEVNKVTQTLSTSNLILHKGAVEIDYKQSLRLMGHLEMDAIAAASGLVLQNRMSDWSGRPFEASSQRIISIYENA